MLGKQFDNFNLDLTNMQAISIQKGFHSKTKR